MDFDRKKVLSFIYALAIAGIVSCLLGAIYNITFANVGSNEEIFIIANILCIALAFLTATFIFLNMFLKNKLFWLEIAFASALIISLVIMMFLDDTTYYTSAYMTIWFEAIASSILLIISRLCLKFITKKENKIKNKENN